MITLESSTLVQRIIFEQNMIYFENWYIIERILKQQEYLRTLKVAKIAQIKAMSILCTPKNVNGHQWIENAHKWTYREKHTWEINAL